MHKIEGYIACWSRHTCVVRKASQLELPIPGEVTAFQSSGQNIAQCLVKPHYFSIAGRMVGCCSCFQVFRIPMVLHNSVITSDSNCGIWFEWSCSGNSFWQKCFSTRFLLQSLLPDQGEHIHILCEIISHHKDVPIALLRFHKWAKKIPIATICSWDPTLLGVNGALAGPFLVVQSLQVWHLVTFFDALFLWWCINLPFHSFPCI